MKRYFFALLMIFAMLPGANAQVAPVLTWITNSSLKLEQVIGDIDWAANAQSSNLLTASQTVTRFHILGNGQDWSKLLRPSPGPHRKGLADRSGFQPRCL